MTEAEQAKLHHEHAERVQRRANFGVATPKLSKDDVVSRHNSSLANVGKWTRLKVPGSPVRLVLMHFTTQRSGHVNLSVKVIVKMLRTLGLHAGTMHRTDRKTSPCPRSGVFANDPTIQRQSWPYRTVD